MPKRQSEEDLIQVYKKKIKKLERKKHQTCRRRRVIVYSDSESDFEKKEEIENKNNDNETIVANSLSYDDLGTTQSQNDNPDLEQSNEIQDILPSRLPSDDAIIELDPDIRLALGDPAEEIAIFGENIHVDIAQRWEPILRKGLTKEVKDKLLKEYNVPENCRLLKAPKLNPEISAAVADIVRARDKKIESKQGQLGLGITAISKAMSTLITNGNKVSAIKHLSEGCRILCDLLFTETQTRTKLITPCLDKSFSITSILQDETRDDTLFGNKVSEKIKAAKAIEKQGLQLKRNIPSSSKAVLHTQASRFKHSGNLTNPPRHPSSASRGARGGMFAAYRTPNTQYRRNQAQVSTVQPTPPPPPIVQTRQHAASRSRAPMQH